MKINENRIKIINNILSDIQFTPGVNNETPSIIIKSDDDGVPLIADQLYKMEIDRKMEEGKNAILDMDIENMFNQSKSEFHNAKFKQVSINGRLCIGPCKHTGPMSGCKCSTRPYKFVIGSSADLV